MSRTEAPVAREELERLVHDYRHVREEHRHARRGGRLRRRLGARLLELEERFEHVLAALPLEEETRRGWREHLHHHAPPPATPPAASPLALEQGASVPWPGRAEAPVSVHLRGDVPARARAELEQALRTLARHAPHPLLHARGSLERLPDRALERPVVARASLDVGGRPVLAHADAATAAEAIALLEARLRRALADAGEREQAERRRPRG